MRRAAAATAAAYARAAPSDGFEVTDGPNNPQACKLAWPSSKEKYNVQTILIRRIIWLDQQ